MNEDEKDDFFLNFKISSNLQQVDTLLPEELKPYIWFLTDKYLKVTKNISSQEKREIICNSLFYDHNFLLDIIGIFKERDSSISVKFVFTEFLSHVKKYNDIIDQLLLDLSHISSSNIKIISIKNKRRTLEDRICCSTNILRNVCHRDQIYNEISMFGVFDGHSGVHAAQYLSLCLNYKVASSILTNLTQIPDLISVEILSSDLGKIVKELNTFYLQHYKDKKSGATINIVLKLEKSLIFLNLGDSQSYIMKKDGTFINMTPLLHNLSVESERNYVISKGGNVHLDSNGIYRIHNRFCLSRSFGDDEFQHYFNPEPDIIIYNMDDTEKCVVIGTDGFWEGVDPIQLASSLCQTTSKCDMDQCVDTFARDAMIEVEDNITVIVVPL